MKKGVLFAVIILIAISIIGAGLLFKDSKRTGEENNPLGGLQNDGKIAFPSDITLHSKRLNISFETDEKTGYAKGILTVSIIYSSPDAEKLALVLYPESLNLSKYDSPLEKPYAEYAPPIFIEFFDSQSKEISFDTSRTENGRYWIHVGATNKERRFNPWIGYVGTTIRIEN